MTRQQLIEQVRKKKSFLCVGLDTDESLIPRGMKMMDFNKAIIDATRDLCVAYKPNIAFYESLGSRGWDVLGETVDYIGGDHFTIADAKRADIGNTSEYYAKTFFDTYRFDSVTVAPYMGKDSVMPFLSHKDKWAIILALTSNAGATDFQLTSAGDKQLFEQVLAVASTWGTSSNTMFVVGATQAMLLSRVRKYVPDHFLLVPGVGAQGGSLREVAQHGMNKDCGLLVNSSRGILYASASQDFASAAHGEAKKIQQEMSSLLDEFVG